MFRGLTETCVCLLKKLSWNGQIDLILIPLLDQDIMLHKLHRFMYALVQY